MVALFRKIMGSGTSSVLLNGIPGELFFFGSVVGTDLLWIY